MKSLLRTTLLVGAALLAAPSLLHADVMARITRKSGGQIQGMTRWQAANKKYVVTVKQGQVDTLMEVPVADVANVQVQAPPNFKQAIQAKNTAVLEKIMKDYTMLQYDAEAGYVLARIYLGQGKNADALRACKSVLNANPNAIHTNLAPVYWKALLANGQGADLAPILDAAIREDPPAVAAGALLVRGDLLRADNKLKEALTDGYLRVVALYRAQREVQPEALAKAAEVFEQLQQPQYAQKMRQELLTRYADSAEANKLRGQ